MSEEQRLTKEQWLEFMMDNGYSIVRVEKPDVLKIVHMTQQSPPTTLETLSMLLFGLCVLGVTALLLINLGT